MAFTLDTLAQELGIDPATLQAKSDVVAKWNGYLSEADSKYSQATEAQKKAEATLQSVEEEQRVIDQQIQQFGMTEANVAALRANNAAMEASLKTLKEQGFDVKIPETPKAPEPAAFDPNAFRADVNNTLVHGFNVMNKYQRIFGKALPDDVDALAREAAAARMPFAAYAEKKYDFAGEEARLNQVRVQKQMDEYAAQKVKEYQEQNPVTQGNPELQRGVQSRHPQLVRQREGTEHKSFANMPARNKIAASVARSREALKSA